MLNIVRKIVRFSSSSKGSKITFLVWLAAIVLITAIAPGSSEYEGNVNEGSVKENKPSEIAHELYEEAFPSDDGLTGLLVFHRDDEITREDRVNITEFSKWLSSEDKPKDIEKALPYHEFPETIQNEMYSEDGTTLLFNFTLREGLESKDAHEVIDALVAKAEQLKLDLEVEVTGPAGIAADTIAIFQNADFVLMIATIVLIFILLIVIYRSPLLAIIPLFIAALVYQVVDRIIGFAGMQEWFVVDGAAVSIMLVLLFAVLTDYSLFIFSRYREKLKKYGSKYRSMSEAMYYVSEPIMFSGGTILLAVLTLFTASFKPYNSFAPVFAIAIVVITLAGLTLIPSLFALVGRRAFWPSIPKQSEESKVEKGLWSKVGKLVMKRPGVTASVLTVVFLIGVINVFSINYSFNLMKSFPEDMSSRKGFELLEDHYSAGQLAPIQVLLQTDDKFELNDELVNDMNDVINTLKHKEGIESVLPEREKMTLEELESMMSEDERTFHFQLVLEENPYEAEALQVVEELRVDEEKLLEGSSFSSIHFAGQTAEQLDVRSMNTRDIIVIFSLVTLLITGMLRFQTRSLKMAILMMATILFSYVATLGFGWAIFHYVLGFESISYRLPLYTFVFMVALGIDYNIMLVSRITEEAVHYEWTEAVGRGIALTGGVISSAGIILAATFAVLITQPLQELFLFGLTMALGILLDTFLIRGALLPSLFILLKNQLVRREKNEKQLQSDVT